jgi:hypothetical protein
LSGIKPHAFKAASSRILQESCLSCRGELAHQAHVAPARSEQRRCVHCHRMVGHGERAAMGHVRLGETVATQLRKP